MQLQQMSQQYDHEINLQQQKIEQSDNYTAELKQQLSETQNNTATTLEQERERFKDDRKALNAKIDELTHQVKTLDRENTTLKTSKQSIEETMKKRQSEANEASAVQATEKVALTEKVDEL